MAYDTIILEIEDHVALITLNRPQAMNALNGELLTELAQAVEEADANDKVRCIVITGSEKAFAAGADITEMAEKSFVDMFTENYFGRQSTTLMQARKPIIAAVAGYCLGGGCELAMMCDFIIASESAKFGQPEITLGVMPGMGGTQRFAKYVGKAKAMDMVLTGRMMDSEEAERCGLVSRRVPDNELLEEAIAAGQKISDFSLPSVLMAKEAVNRAFETSLEEGLRFERRGFHSLFALEDQKEGMTAFVEKRSPSFKNR